MWIYIALLVFGTQRFADGLCEVADKINFYGGNVGKRQEMYSNDITSAAEKCKKKCEDTDGCETFKLDTKRYNKKKYFWEKNKYFYFCWFKRGTGYRTLSKRYRSAYHVGCNDDNEKGKYSCLRYRVKYKDPDSGYTAVANVSRVEDCYEKCNQQSQCIHFSFKTVSGECYMYGYSKAGTLFTIVDEDADSYISANKPCWDSNTEDTGIAGDVKSVNTVSYEMTLNAGSDSWPEDNYGRHWGNVHDGPPP
eukprot:245071_1